MLTSIAADLNSPVHLPASLSTSSLVHAMPFFFMSLNLQNNIAPPDPLMRYTHDDNDGMTRDKIDDGINDEMKVMVKQMRKVIV